MENKNIGDYFESNVRIIQFALKQWKLLGGVAIVAGILAGLFSSPKFIEPKYTSEAVIYPANLGEYSGETQLEQMMQYLESNVIRDSIIEKFNLYDEYKIDRTQKSSKNQIIKVYGEHFSFDETRFESISMTATSTDPEKSRLMLDAIIDQLDRTIRETEREKYRETLKINKGLLDQKRKQLDSLENTIKEISVKYGILDYIAQAEEVTKGYMKFLLSGKKGPGYEEAKQLYDNLGEHGSYYHNLHAQLNTVNEEYMNRLHDYEHALKDVKKVQTYSYVLVKPETPDKKSSPIRWLIVLVSMVTCTGFTFVLLLFLGYQKR